MHTIPLKPNFKVAEAAFYVGCSERTLQRRIKEQSEGDRYYLKARKTGNGKNSHYLISREDLIAYLENSTVGAMPNKAA